MTVATVSPNAMESPASTKRLEARGMRAMATPPSSMPPMMKGTRPLQSDNLPIKGLANSMDTT